MTTIEWTDVTWNPSTGCDRVSPGCDHCYAMTMAKRLKGMGQEKYQRDGDPKTSGPGFGITEHAEAVYAPLRWRKPRKVFVNSMSDLFHAGVSDEFITLVWAVMAATPQHTYQILTKRHGRMHSLLNRRSFHADVAEEVFSSLDLTSDAADQIQRRSWPLANVWLGVSVEDQKRADLRIPALLKTPAAVRFLSCEPLLGLVDLVGPTEGECDEVGPAITHRAHQIRTDYGTGLEYDCEHQVGVDWVIVGGESGPGARPMHPYWARQLRDQCVELDVPFLFKQWGSWVQTGEQLLAKDHKTMALHTAGMTAQTHDNPFNPFKAGHPYWVPMRNVGKHAAGRELDGRTWDEYPTTVTS
jgi:protein gp37